MRATRWALMAHTAQAGRRLEVNPLLRGHRHEDPLDTVLRSMHEGQALGVADLAELIAVLPPAAWREVGSRRYVACLGWLATQVERPDLRAQLQGWVGSLSAEDSEAFVDSALSLVDTAMRDAYNQRSAGAAPAPIPGVSFAAISARWAAALIPVLPPDWETATRPRRVALRMALNAAAAGGRPSDGEEEQRSLKVFADVVDAHPLRDSAASSDARLMDAVTAARKEFFAAVESIYTTARRLVRDEQPLTEVAASAVGSAKTVALRCMMHAPGDHKYVSLFFKLVRDIWQAEDAERLDVLERYVSNERVKAHYLPGALPGLFHSMKRAVDKPFVKLAPREMCLQVLMQTQAAVPALQVVGGMARAVQACGPGQRKHIRSRWGTLWGVSVYVLLTGAGQRAHGWTAVQVLETVPQFLYALGGLQGHRRGKERNAVLVVTDSERVAILDSLCAGLGARLESFHREGNLRGRFTLAKMAGIVRLLAAQLGPGRRLVPALHGLCSTHLAGGCRFGDLVRYLDALPDDVPLNANNKTAHADWGLWFREGFTATAARTPDLLAACVRIALRRHREIDVAVLETVLDAAVEADFAAARPGRLAPILTLLHAQKLWQHPACTSFVVYSRTYVRAAAAVPPQ
eukprot:TRINITY_DN18555_c0_g1_i1.p1 TRINITY_DN18555_c0_g1~~TRINITY_DN18555_c0_g1_i1.p1  ORF type:complete len:633 (+),score=81.37 TRINITY_DN18555_c0_g1_i1:69-1967(+)